MHLVIIGFIGGFTSGLLGIGGGIVMVPLLAYVAGLSFHMATTISLAQILVGALSGGYRHYRLGNVNLRIGLILGVCSALAAIVASYFSPRVPADSLQVAYLILLVISGGMLLIPKREPAEGMEPVPPVLPVAILGATAGLVTGFLGAGGGFFMVPVMIYGLGLRTKTSIGTSLVAIIFGSLAGGFTKLVTGQFDLGIAFLVVLGGAVGAQAGAMAANRLSARLLRLMLLAVLVVIAARVLFGLLGI